MSLFCLALQVSCSDQYESSYPSLADAKRAGAVDRGWLPDFLPPGSRDIHEVHNIDTNQTWCAFAFVFADSDVLRRNLLVLGSAEISAIYVRSPGLSWWPDVLEGQLDPDAIARSGFEMYGTGSVVFAIDWKKGRAFFYRERA